MRTGVAVLLAGLAGCAGRGPTMEARPLVGSLEVQVVGDTVWLGLHVTNTSAAPIELQFASAQRYDFEVRAANGTGVWQWSADRSFAQVQGAERLAPGATWQDRVRWVSGAREGEHVAVGRLVSTSHPVELTTRFELGRE